MGLQEGMAEEASGEEAFEALADEGEEEGVGALRGYQFSERGGG